MKTNEQRKEFERKLRSSYAEATVYKGKKLFMKNGKILNEELWKDKVDKAWENRRKYPKMTRRGRQRNA